MRFRTVFALAVSFALVGGLGFAQSRLVKEPPKAGGDERGLNLPSPAYGFVTNPKDYYVEVWQNASSQGGALLNPLPSPSCRWVYTYGNSSNNSTTQLITAVNEDTPDWAFQVTLPVSWLEQCYGAVLYITWDGQADTPAESHQNQGIAFRCEVEQWDGPTRYRVPCPGTHFFTPWIIRADTVANGQQNHTAYSGAMGLPWYVNDYLLAGAKGDPPRKPAQAWGDVTFRFGFVVRTANSNPHRVWNQNLMLEVGPPMSVYSAPSRNMP